MKIEIFDFDDACGSLGPMLEEVNENSSVSSVSSDDEGVGDPVPEIKKAKKAIFLDTNPQLPGNRKRKYQMPKRGTHRRTGGSPPKEC